MFRRPCSWSRTVYRARHIRGGQEDVLQETNRNRRAGPTPPPSYPSPPHLISYTALCVHTIPRWRLLQDDDLAAVMELIDTKSVKQARL